MKIMKHIGFLNHLRGVKAHLGGEQAFFLFVGVSVLYIGAVFWITSGKTFRLDSDYDSNFPIISYVVDTIRNEKRLPFWNPYVTTGISVFGDPLSGVAYLPYLLPMLAFGVPDGWWVAIGVHAFGAGAAMWMLLKKILDSRFRGNDNKDSGNDKNLLALWGGLLYMGTGAFAARVAAGHIEKILSFAWYPLFLLFLLRLFNCDFERLLRPAKGRGLAMTSSAAIGAIMGIVFLTGDVYGLLFMGIWYGVIGIIRGIRGIRVIGEIGVTIAAFIAVAGVKLVPFVLQVVPVMSRYSEFDAARGSIHAIYTWIPFVMPWGVVFYDRTVFQRFFNFWYNWYEYYAFIGLPLLYLVGLPRIIKKREVQLLLMLLVVGCMYIARGYPYSLFYWVEKSVPFLTWFRVPQRMYEALTSVVVVLIVLSAERLIRPPLAKSQGVALRTLVLFWGILLVTFLVSGYQMMQGFEKPRLEEEAVVRELRRRDGGDISVVTFACCMQTFLVRERIRVINYYYGWIPKGAPRFIRADGSAFSLEAIQTSRPTYIIAPKAMNFGEFGYTIWFGEGEIVVWRASTLTNYIRPGLPKG